MLFLWSKQLSRSATSGFILPSSHDNRSFLKAGEERARKEKKKEKKKEKVFWKISFNPKDSSSLPRGSSSDVFERASPLWSPLGRFMSRVDRVGRIPPPLSGPGRHCLPCQLSSRCSAAQAALQPCSSEGRGLPLNLISHFICKMSDTTNFFYCWSSRPLHGYVSFLLVLYLAMPFLLKTQNRFIWLTCKWWLWISALCLRLVSVCEKREKVSICVCVCWE